MDGPGDELARALRHEELAVHYQPIVELRTGAARGGEALLRWHHPTRGLLAAGAFLPAYEGAAVMRDVTSFVLSRACAEVAAGAPADWRVSINITAADACRESLVDEVDHALGESGLASERLVLEVTETGVLSNHERAASVLGRLRDVGVAIALDDFGTGYSSMSLLRRLPVSELKVDAVFVADVESSREDAAIVANLVRLADSFGATVVAEGVEQLGQARVLTQLGCGFGQGYLWSRPEELASLVSRLGEPTTAGRRSGPPKLIVDRVQDLSASGASANSIAAALNGEGLRTETGKRWHAASVQALMEDLQRARSTVRSVPPVH